MLRYCYSPFKVVVGIVEIVVVRSILVLKAYTKPEAIKIVTEAAKDYAENLRPKVVKFFKFSKMTTILDVYKPFLEVDRLVGNISCCLGFLKEGNYYIPNSCLLSDIV